MSSRAAVPILLAVFWLAPRPYRGVFHDTRFYVADAIGHLHPLRFASDLFFHYGAQGKFSIFTSLYAPLITTLGLSRATLLLTLTGQLLWLAGLVYLVSGFIPDRRFLRLSIAAALALPGHYGTFLVYGEQFVTPRLFAEALTLLALGLLLRRRAVWGLMLLGVAALLHPLLALPGLAFALLYLAFGDKRWWGAIGAGALLAVGLAVAGVSPFSHLLVTIDPEWFAIVRVRDAMCLITQWSAADFLRAIGTGALSVLALLLMDRDDRRVLGTAMIVGFGGIACTFSGGDLAHNFFIVEIQTWRAMWLLTLLANLYAVPVFIRLLEQGEAADLTRLAFATALGALLLSRFAPPLIYIAAPMMAATAALAVWQRQMGRALPRRARPICLAVLAIAWTATIIFVYEFIPFMRAWPDELVRRLFAFALVAAALGLMALCYIAAERPHRWLRCALPVAAAVLLVPALAGWDARTAWSRFLETEAPAPPELAALLPPDKSVYWEGGVEMLWFRLRRPSYFSCTQGTEALFFRGTAIEYQRRAESFWPLRTLDFGQSTLCPPLDTTDKPRRTPADLERLCRREPGLDYLVLTRPVEQAAAKIWTAPAKFRDVRTVDGKLRVFETDRFYIYACAEIR